MKRALVIFPILLAFVLGNVVGILASVRVAKRQQQKAFMMKAHLDLAEAYVPLKALHNGHTKGCDAALRANLQGALDVIRILEEECPESDIPKRPVVKEAMSYITKLNREQPIPGD